MGVLITGATGLVGQELQKTLHSKGIPVNYLTRNKNKLGLHGQAKGFYWNPANGEIDTACFEGIHTIINLAGATISKKWTKTYKRKVLQSRVESINTMFNALRKSGPSHIKTVISASAIGIYPNSLTEFYDENTKAVDDSFLGEIVLAWENAISKLKTVVDRVAVVRIGLVLSDEGGALPKMATPIQYFVGAPFGSGLQWQSWIHINDLAGIFVHIMENHLKGVYNGVAPNPVTQSKLIQTLAKVLQRPVWLPNVPKFMMRLILGEMAYLLFASQRVSSKRIEKKGYAFKFANLEAALQDLYGDKSQHPSI
ncbi:TIGR01777 family oxidoreductase [Muricauda sp. 2012CJ35-5]|uniref:TIGR01777 family oxidoreductase n=1 Tax=Flagellimonas spongiicola TaxID=2942208 RepID=A0ABT0PMR2_9FLAO|nr:TIGR01777 family oxidoreductase [Allomuricauda spongiicola]MCL6272680.1 TIGR01777 family oxidoreductase [Allomuricauda spongiicola]